MIILQIPGCYGSSLFQAFSAHLVHRLHIPQDGPVVCNRDLYMFIQAQVNLLLYYFLLIHMF